MNTVHIQGLVSQLEFGIRENRERYSKLLLWMEIDRFKIVGAVSLNLNADSQEACKM
jgi:hypothetical protein